MLEILIRYREAFLHGLTTTLSLCGTAWLIGVTLGVVLGFCAAKLGKSLGRIVGALAFFHSAFPLLILLYWVHYPGQALLGLNLNGYWTTLFVLSITVTFAIAEALKQSLVRFPEDLLQAAHVCGVPQRRVFIDIQLPILARNLTPALLAILLVALHGSLFASMISVTELFRTAQEINAVEYRPIEVYSALALFFLVICLPLHSAARGLQRWSDRLFG